MTLDRVLRSAAVLIVLSSPALGQGGPPLLTDDPGTPGPGQWEINVAFTMDRTSETRELGPLVDANYGWGERVQLKLEIPWIVKTGKGEQTKNGIGNPLFGMKWRFLDEERAGVAVSTYPQVGFNLVRSSVDEGLVESRRTFLLPISAVKTLGPLSVNVEAGGLFGAGPPLWIWGVALGHPLAPSVEALAELFGTASTDAVRRQAIVNLGLRWKLAPGPTLLLSFGKSFYDGGDEEHHLLLYVGLQFSLGRSL